MPDLGTIVDKQTVLTTPWNQAVNDWTYRCTSIALLRVQTKDPGAHFFVLGYYTAGDGGGGLYYYDAADILSADNGGTTIVATDGGRWKLSQAFPVSICQFGADKSGVLDSTTPVANAVLWIRSILGGVLTAPTGTFLFTGGINLEDAFEVTLQGAGGRNVGSHINGTLFKYTGTAARFVSMRSAFGSSVNDISLTFTSAAFNGSLIDMSHSALARDSAFCQVNNCLLSSFNGILTNGNGINLDKAINVTIEKTEFSGMNTAILGQDAAGGSYSNQVVVRYCTFTFMNSAPIQGVGLSWTIDDNTFENLVDGSSGAVLTTALTPTAAGSFSRNWCGDSTAGTGTWVKLFGNGGAGGEAIGGWTIATNWMYGAFYTGAPHGTAISLNNMDGVGVRENNVQGFANFIDFGTATVSNFSESGNTLGTTGANAVTNRYANASNCSSFSSGHTILPNGKLWQWGQASVTQGTPLLVSYPVAFSSAPTITLTLQSPTGGANTAFVSAGVAMMNFTANVAGTAGVNLVNWHAIGDA